MFGAMWNAKEIKSICKKVILVKGLKCSMAKVSIYFNVLPRTLLIIWHILSNEQCQGYSLDIKKCCSPIFN